jgi:hypothetical protein
MARVGYDAAARHLCWAVLACSRSLLTLFHGTVRTLFYSLGLQAYCEASAVPLDPMCVRLCLIIREEWWWYLSDCLVRSVVQCNTESQRVPSYYMNHMV